jgi:hypothetical protein
MAHQLTIIELFIILAGAAFVLALVILLGAFVIVKLQSNKGAASKSSPPEVWPVYARRLMSPSEQVLYQRLVEALPSKIVLAQVQLSRIVEVKNVPKRIVWLNKILPLSWTIQRTTGTGVRRRMRERTRHWLPRVCDSFDGMCVIFHPSKASGNSSERNLVALIRFSPAHWPLKTY